MLLGKESRSDPTSYTGCMPASTADVGSRKIINLRQDIEHNPYKYLSNTPGGVQVFASQLPDPH